MAQRKAAQESRPTIPDRFRGGTTPFELIEPDAVLPDSRALARQHLKQLQNERLAKEAAEAKSKSAPAVS